MEIKHRRHNPPWVAIVTHDVFFFSNEKNNIKK